MPRHWKSFLGALGVLPVVWQGGKWAVDWIGRYDVVRTHYAEVRPVLDLFLTAPGNLLLMFAGLGLIWWDLRRTKDAAPVSATPAMPVVQHQPSLSEAPKQEPGHKCEFFPTRPDLIRAHGSLGDRLRNASHVDAIWVIGQRFLHAGQNLHVLKRLLLPNPNGAAFKHHSRVSQHGETIDYIRGMTELALRKGIKVKWYDHFVFHSINLVDTGTADGWVHFESVLPYSNSEQRPSFTVYRKDSELTVSEAQRIFNEMWEAAKDAPGS